jgi:EmrB/QacA subfamily drug resistance transporter
VSEANGNPTASDRQAPAPGRRQLLLVFAGLMLAVLLAALDQTIVATALPTIVGELHGLEHMSWAVTAYLLAATIGLIVYGKLGDQFGRKPVFVLAILVFLLGSALAGLAQTMGQLIAFRALQGIGGGGLTIGAQAIVGEFIAPRERGRYLGAFFGMFGLASVAGPLLGGYLTDAWSWRWCFYINLPLGAVTLAIVTAVLPLPRHPTRPHLDYLGAALLAAAVTCMLLVTSWGGTRYAWASPTIIALGVAAAVLLGGFVLAERRAPEPVVPLRPFRSRVFNVANGLGLVIGVVLFGTIVYVPAFFQMAQGVSATQAGLRMLPMMAGLLAAAVWAGQRISATGTYKRFPIAGMASGAAGLALLSRLGADTPYPLAASFLLVLGVGMGLSMQVIVLAIQNDAPPGDLGAATSATNFLRQLGGSFGTAAFGAVFASRLADQLAARLPADAGARLPAGGVNAITPALVHTLPPPVRAGFIGAYVDAWRPSSATWCPWRWWRSRWRGCCPSCHCAATSQAPDLPARPCRLDARAQAG